MIHTQNTYMWFHRKAHKEDTNILTINYAFCIFLALNNNSKAYKSPIQNIKEKQYNHSVLYMFLHIHIKHNPIYAHI